MLVLETGDKVQGDAATAAEVDYTIHGLDNNSLKQLADGQLANAIGDLYTADSTDVVSTITLVNTGSAQAVNLYFLASGGTARRLIPKDMSLGAGYSLHTDGKSFTVADASGNVQTTGGGAYVEDDAYGAGWNGDTSHAPSQNAVYDAFNAHKDRHDPNDGADALDTAAAAEIVGVQAAGTGTSHSLARADHAHQIQHSIANNHLVTIDGTTNTPANLDYAKFTASGLEGKAYSEVKTDLGAGAASGLATLNASTKVVEQPASVSDHLDDTAGGVNAEVTKASTANVIYDHGVATTGVHGGGIGDADGDTKIQCEESADEDIIRMDVAGVEAFVLQDTGKLDLPKQSRARAYKAATNQPTNPDKPRVILLDTESFDEHNEYDTTVKSGTADATEAKKLHDADGGFAAGDVGKIVWNTTDHTYSIVTAFVDSGELTLNVDTMVSGETYKLYQSRFTAGAAGYYVICGNGTYVDMTDQHKYAVWIYKNGTWVAQGRGVGSGTNYVGDSVSAVLYLAANDYIELVLAQYSDSAKSVASGERNCNLSIHKIS